MKRGMNLQELLAEVIRTNENKVDYVADTKETIRMVAMPDFAERDDDGNVTKPGVAIVLNNTNHIGRVLSENEPLPLQRFRITDNCHEQIASRLKVPKKYYDRLLSDHTDLVLQNVNTLFEREPALRMVRTLDGKARAFLSNQYRRVDNAQVLEQTLPVIKEEFDTRLIGSYVDENRMRIKCLFTDDNHKTVIGKTRNGGDDVVQAGFEMGNSETGRGTFYIRGFFYRGYCDNGCVWGGKEHTNMRIVHVGGAQTGGRDFVLSQETQRKEDELIVAASRDVLRHLGKPETTQQLGETLLALSERRPVQNPHAAVEEVCKVVGMSEGESNRALESFIADQDYSQWGMVNAVTAVANSDDVTHPRALKLEEAGSKIIELPASQWNRIAQLERVAA